MGAGWSPGEGNGGTRWNGMEGEYLEKLKEGSRQETRGGHQLEKKKPTRSAVPELANRGAIGGHKFRHSRKRMPCREGGKELGGNPQIRTGTN